MTHRAIEMKKQDLSHFSPDEIRPAAENHLLYDATAPLTDDDDLKLYLSIKKDGIREPLTVSADGIILSGHRRHAAAKWLGLDEVPCIVADDVVFGDLTADERLSVLATYNKQRDKSHAERLREAMLEIDPDDVYAALKADRAKRQKVNIESNIDLGEYKRRARITTRVFLKAAQWVLEAEENYWPLTVRRVHYLILNDPPLRHDKKPGSTYQNDKASYKSLTNLLLRARLAGHISHEAIEDDTRPIRELATHQGPADFIKDATEDFLSGYARDLLRGQAHHIEILVEKDGLRRHVETVADEYCVPCTTGRGYASLTPRYKMVQRFRRSGKAKLILLVLSDFDPDGEKIAQSFPRSLRDDFGVTNILAHSVALSKADVLKYNLPFDHEAKMSSPNYVKFVARHGTHVAELDAAPVELLQDKLRNAIESCLNMDIFRAELAREKEDAVFIAATKKAVVRSIGPKI